MVRKGKVIQKMRRVRLGHFQSINVEESRFAIDVAYVSALTSSSKSWVVSITATRESPQGPQIERKARKITGEEHQDRGRRVRVLIIIASLDPFRHGECPARHQQLSTLRLYRS